MGKYKCNTITIQIQLGKQVGPQRPSQPAFQEDYAGFSLAKPNLVSVSSLSSWMVNQMTWHQGNLWGAFMFLCFHFAFCISLDMVDWPASGINALVEQVTDVKISWKWPLAILFKVCLCKIGWHTDKLNLTSPNLNEVDVGIALKITKSDQRSKGC